MRRYTKRENWENMDVRGIKRGGKKRIYPEGKKEKK